MIWPTTKKHKIEYYICDENNKNWLLYLLIVKKNTHCYGAKIRCSI